MEKLTGSKVQNSEEGAGHTLHADSTGGHNLRNRGWGKGTQNRYQEALEAFMFVQRKNSNLETRLTRENHGEVLGNREGEIR